jgi:hypothetical protein
VSPDPFVDERRTAPPVREWASIRRERSQLAVDRTALSRRLFAAGLSKTEIAEVLGVDWVKVDFIISGVAK